MLQKEGLSGYSSAAESPQFLAEQINDAVSEYLNVDQEPEVPARPKKMTIQPSDELWQAHMDAHVAAHKEKHGLQQVEVGASGPISYAQESEQVTAPDGPSSGAQTTRTVAAVSPNYKTQQEIIDETRAVMLQRAVEMERNAVLQSECAHFGGHTPFLQYEQYNSLTRMCVLKCEADKTFWDIKHSCLVRQLRQIVNSNQTLWMWHFGQWVNNDCQLSPGVTDETDEWFEHDGCDADCELKDQAVCAGCFSGCRKPANTDIALRYTVARRSQFKNGDRLTFECAVNHCWAAGVPKKQLSGQCNCDERTGHCSWGVCFNGECEESPMTEQSLLQQGCTDCTGGRCVRAINAHKCETLDQTSPDEMCMQADDQPALYKDGETVRFQCGQFHTNLMVSDQLVDVAVPRCWKDGRKESVQALCHCPNPNECMFKEYVNNTEVYPNIFANGCLVDQCKARPNTVATSGGGGAAARAAGGR